MLASKLMGAGGFGIKEFELLNSVFSGSDSLACGAASIYGTVTLAAGSGTGTAPSINPINTRNGFIHRGSRSWGVNGSEDDASGNMTVGSQEDNQVGVVPLQRGSADTSFDSYRIDTFLKPTGTLQYGAPNYLGKIQGNINQAINFGGGGATLAIVWCTSPAKTQLDSITTNSMTIGGVAVDVSYKMASGSYRHSGYLGIRILPSTFVGGNLTVQSGGTTASHRQETGSYYIRLA